MARVSIRTLAVLFCLITGIAGEVGAQIKDLKKIRLNVFRPDAATVTAKVRGLFRAEGLEVEISETPSSTDQMRGLSQGKFDMVSTGFDNVLAWSGKEGAEIVAVAQVVDKTVLAIFVRPEIRNWSDLKGKKLAVDAADTAFALVLRRVLLANGLDVTKGDYELVAYGATGARFDSLIKGETFAAILGSLFDIKALDAGMRLIGDSKEVLPDYSNSIIAVTREWGQKNRDLLLAFLRVRLKASAWVSDPANREEAIKLLSAEWKMNSKQTAERMDEVSPTGKLNLPGLQVVLDLRNQFGFKLPKGDKLPAYYDSQYIDAANEK